MSLLTTVTQDYDRVSMHGFRRELLEKQVQSLGIPLKKVVIGKKSSNRDYEAEMERVLTGFMASSVRHVVFGDIFLEDLRRYRESNLEKLGLSGVFPLWKRETSELARTFLDNGFKAIITCVDTDVLGREFAGRDFDEQFLQDLPADIDPCGENGEFHSFVYDGPVFSRPVPVKKGEVVLRDNRFCFCDLLPG
jgi:uncharacterized protein (TIGR00290 family)